MAAVVYKCPGCGSFVQDAEGKDILICPHCGNTISKVVSEEEKQRRYNAAEKERQNKESRKTMKIVGIFLLVVFALGIALHFMRAAGMNV